MIRINKWKWTQTGTGTKGIFNFKLTIKSKTVSLINMKARNGLTYVLNALWWVMNELCFSPLSYTLSHIICWKASTQKTKNVTIWNNKSKSVYRQKILSRIWNYFRGSSNSALSIYFVSHKKSHWWGAMIVIFWKKNIPFFVYFIIFSKFLWGIFCKMVETL